MNVGEGWDDSSHRKNDFVRIGLALMAAIRLFKTKRFSFVSLQNYSTKVSDVVCHGSDDTRMRFRFVGY